MAFVYAGSYALFVPRSVAAVALAFIVVDCCFYWASVVVASPNSNVLRRRTVNTPSSCFALILRRSLIRLVIYLDPSRFERIKRTLVCWEWIVGMGSPWERQEEKWEQPPGMTNNDPANERLRGRGIVIFWWCLGWACRRHNGGLKIVGEYSGRSWLLQRRHCIAGISGDRAARRSEKLVSSRHRRYYFFIFCSRLARGSRSLLFCPHPSSSSSVRNGV